MKNKIIQGDSLEELKKLPDNSVDAVVTDPPYGLGFMNKEWDSPKKHRELVERERKRSAERKEQGKSPTDAPFSQSVQPGLAIKGAKEGRWFQEWCELWSKELLRILKPGGYFLSFSATRTYHRMVCGIEDAGFEIRDMISWLYGSGFPKSLNVGKQIKKIDKNNNDWDSFGTALKPAVEPIVVARKPLSEKNVALNVLKWGTGGINIDACRVGNEIIKEHKSGDTSLMGGLTGKSEQGGHISPEHQGRFPANLILDEEAGKLLDEQTEGKVGNGHWSKTKTTGFGKFGNGKSEYFGVGEKDKSKGGASRFFYNVSDEELNLIRKNIPKDIQNRIIKFENSLKNKDGTYVDTSKLDMAIYDLINYINPKASRFFYCAKASKSERNYGCDELEFNTKGFRPGEGLGGQQIEMIKKNSHPTVKSLGIMEYLIKLVSREGALVLDPFLGSGTTAIACVKLNRQYIGIEREPDYIKIAEARIKPFLEQKKL